MVSGLERARTTEAALCELTDGGFLYEAEVYPERVFAFRHPLTREVAYGTQLAEQRAATHAAAARALIELNPDRHDELAALIAHHMEEGGETLEAARWSARAAYWAGQQPAPGRAAPLARGDGAGRRAGGERGDDGAGGDLAPAAARLRLAPGHGHGGGSAPGRRGRGDRDRTGDLRSLALLSWRPRPDRGCPTTPTTWLAAVAEANRLADESGDLHLRIAIRAAGSYAHLCAGDKAFAHYRW